MIKIGEEKCLDITEVAKKVGVSITTVKVRVRAQEMPLPAKLKHKTFWKLSEIEDYINNKGAEK